MSRDPEVDRLLVGHYRFAYRLSMTVTIAACIALLLIVGRTCG